MRRAFISLLAAGLAFTGTAFAWDPMGHMIVGKVAYDGLTPEARAAVDKSLAEFNRKNKTDYTFVTVGCWMDDVRPTRKEYSPWHYIELPYTREGEPFPDPNKINALWGIGHCVAILKGEITDPGVDKDQALVMLTHLVGDIHQPLHTISHNNDKGGNDVKTPNLTDPVVEASPNRKNLHTFWDSAYRRTVKDGLVVESITEPAYPPSADPVKGHALALPIVTENAVLLVKAYQPEAFPATGTPKDWIKESHMQGYDHVYQKLPGGEAANPVTLDQAYVENAKSLANQKLVQGGNRLAGLLNEIFGRKSGNPGQASP